MVLPILLCFALIDYSGDVASGITTAYYNTTLTTSSGIISDDVNSAQYLEPYSLTSEIIFGFNLVTFGSDPNQYYLSLTSLKVDSYLSSGYEIYPDDYNIRWSNTFYSYDFVQQDDMPVWSNPDDPFGYDNLEDMEDLHLNIGIHKTQGYAIDYVVNLTYKGWDLIEYSSNVYTLSNVHTLVDFESDISFADTGNIVYTEIQHYWHSFYFPDVNASYQQGYDNGYGDGERYGYQTGYVAGFEDADNMDETALTIFTGILNVALIPVNFFLAILNFEVFDINIAAFVCALLTIAIVVIVTRIVVSGGNKND